MVSGLLLVGAGWRALKPDRPVSLWIACFVGIWLIFAPVVFWAPTASAYANDSVVGLLVIALTVLIPGMPNMMKFMQMGPPTPPGWSYNPSSWTQRSILIGLGFLGLVVSRYLAAYQLGYIDRGASLVRRGRVLTARPASLVAGVDIERAGTARSDGVEGASYSAVRRAWSVRGLVRRGGVRGRTPWRQCLCAPCRDSGHAGARGRGCGGRRDGRVVSAGGIRCEPDAPGPR